VALSKGGAASHPIIRGGQVGGATHAVESTVFFAGKNVGENMNLTAFFWGENPWEINIFMS